MAPTCPRLACTRATRVLLPDAFGCLHSASVQPCSLTRLPVLWLWQAALSQWHRGTQVHSVSWGFATSARLWLSAPCHLKGQRERCNSGGARRPLRELRCMARQRSCRWATALAGRTAGVKRPAARAGRRHWPACYRISPAGAAPRRRPAAALASRVRRRQRWMRPARRSCPRCCDSACLCGAANPCLAAPALLRHQAGRPAWQGGRRGRS